MWGRDYYTILQVQLDCNIYTVCEPNLKLYAFASAVASYANSFLPAHAAGESPICKTVFMQALVTLVTLELTGFTTQSYGYASLAL